MIHLTNPSCSSSSRGTMGNLAPASYVTNFQQGPGMHTSHLPYYRLHTLTRNQRRRQSRLPDNQGHLCSTGSSGKAGFSLHMPSPEQSPWHGCLTVYTVRPMPLRSPTVHRRVGQSALGKQENGCCGGRCKCPAELGDT